MTIDELISKNIKTLAEFELLANRDRDLFFVPNIISNIVADFATISTPKNAIVLNSNYGEISSKLSEIENLVSIDINPNNIELSNYLNPKLTFINSDPLNYSLSEKFDFVVTFPPFRQRLELNERLNQILYIEKALDLLNENGLAIFILKSSFLRILTSKERNLILNNFGLSKILSLPIGTISHTLSEFKILVVSNSNVLKTDYYVVNKDFTLKEATPTFSVPKEELTQTWDFNFHNPQNQEYKEQLKEKEVRTIRNLVEVSTGTYFNRDEIKSEGTYKIISRKNILNGFLQETARDNFIEKDNFNRREENAILRKGDILFPRTFMFNIGKVTIYVHNSDDNKLIADQNIFILRGRNAEYLARYLKTESGLSLFNQQIKRYLRDDGVTQSILTQDLLTIQIPILPIAHLEHILKIELEKLSQMRTLVYFASGPIRKEYEELDFDRIYLVDNCFSRSISPRIVTKGKIICLGMDCLESIEYLKNHNVKIDCFVSLNEGLYEGGGSYAINSDMFLGYAMPLFKEQYIHIMDKGYYNSDYHVTMDLPYTIEEIKEDDSEYLNPFIFSKDNIRSPKVFRMTKCTRKNEISINSHRKLYIVHDSIWNYYEKLDGLVISFSHQGQKNYFEKLPKVINFNAMNLEEIFAFCEKNKINRLGFTPFGHGKYGDFLKQIQELKNEYPKEIFMFHLNDMDYQDLLNLKNPS